MVLEQTLRPRGPYSLALSARTAGDATRRFRDGVLTCALTMDGHAEAACAWQRHDGTIVMRAYSEPALERLRFVLAVDDDHSEFLRRFKDDPLLRRTILILRGLRPVRVSTVAHALLRALCGQLIQASRARALERAIIKAATPAVGPLSAAPDEDALGEASPAELRRLGLHARRAATLVRLCRTVDLERLRDVSTDAVVDRLLRERGLGPWSVGVICMEGLGRSEHGLVGDLGLVKLCSALEGRWVDAEETAALLARYEEWAGLASVYLLAGWSRGLIPGLPPGTALGAEMAASSIASTGRFRRTRGKAARPEIGAASGAS